MIRKLLEQRGIKLTKAEFAVVMEIVTNDIKFNMINFNKCTSLKYMLDIAEKSAEIFGRCA